MIKSCWSVQASERPSFKSIVASFGERDGLVAPAEAHECRTKKRRHTFQETRLRIYSHKAPQPKVEDELMEVGNNGTDSKDTGDDKVFL